MSDKSTRLRRAAIARSRALPLLLLVISLAAALVVARAWHRPPLPVPSGGKRFVADNLAIQLRVEPVDPSRSGSAPRAGDDVALRFTITDATTGAPVPRAYPAAWARLRDPNEPNDKMTCTARIKRYLERGTPSPEDYDFNIYEVLVLNREPTISVVDPRFGFGGSRLLGMIFLKSPGADLVLLRDQSRLFVSMPAAAAIAVVDTVSFKVIGEIETGPAPGQIALQPDEGYLWVSEGAYAGPTGQPDQMGQLGDGGSTSGVSVISIAERSRKARIATGAGPHRIAFTDDNRFAFVTNHGAGTVSLVDIRALRVVRSVATGHAPTDVTWSRAARAAYVTDETDGTITVIDPDREGLVARVPSAGPGIGAIAFEPRGRLGFLPNPSRDTIEIFDAASNRFVQIGHMSSGPDEVMFSDNLAYVRHRGAEVVHMIPLDLVGHAGAPIPVVDFPGGEHPPGPAGIAPTMVRAPGAAAMLLVNPADKAVYYYKEGNAAPMGHFESYGQSAAAVAILDHSLRERAPGVYDTTMKLKRPGLHEIAFLVDTPRLVHCFDVEVEENPDYKPEGRNIPARVEYLLENKLVPTGATTRLRLRLLDPENGSPLRGLRDVLVLTYMAPGSFQSRQYAVPDSDDTYAIDFVPPRSGTYYATTSAASLGLTFTTPQTPLIFRAVAPSAGIPPIGGPP